MKNIYKLIILTTITLAVSVTLSSVGFGGESVSAASVRCNDAGKYDTYSEQMTKEQTANLCKDMGGVSKDQSGTLPPDPAKGSLKCNILPQSICDSADNGAGKDGADSKNTGIFKLLLWILNIMTAVVGLAAIGAIVYAGIMYSSAGDDSAQVTKAKNLIRDTVIGLIVYGLMFLILNFLIPGGVIG
ncbi:MAG: pilin [Candidatus Saccharimonas sp.]